MEVLEKYNNYTIIDDINNNCYYVEELPFLYACKIFTDALNSIKSDINNYIRNHYIHNDYHIVWKYHAKEWDFDVYTIDEKWHLYENIKSHDVFTILFKTKIVEMVCNKRTVKIKSDISSVNKLICQILDKNDYLSKYFKLDNIPTSLKELHDNLEDISQKTYDISIEKLNFIIKEDIIRSAKLQYITSFINLRIDDYISNDINDTHLRISVEFTPKKIHNDITWFFLYKYITYIFGKIIMKKYYMDSIVISMKPINSLQLINMIELN